MDGREQQLNGNDQPRRARLYAEASAAHGDAIARLARAIERDTDRARDLEQDMHLALWHSLAGFAGACTLSTWTYRVVHNVAADHAVRETRAAPLVTLDAVATFATGEDVEREVGETQTLERLHALIRRLRPTDRSVILLYLEGAATADIAAVTGLLPGNVSVKVHRIKAMLAQHFHTGGTV